MIHKICHRPLKKLDRRFVIFQDVSFDFSYILHRGFEFLLNSNKTREVFHWFVSWVGYCAIEFQGMLAKRSEEKAGNSQNDVTTIYSKVCKKENNLI